MLKVQNRNYAGFTVIEVIIVIAIGGLIFWMLFAAIPAVTRNSQNGQRKQEVALILNALQRYQLNNSGNLPVDHHFADNTKLSFYEHTDIIVTAQAAGAVPATPLPDTEKIYLYNYLLCNGNAASGTGAGYRNIAAFYAVTGGDGSMRAQCQQL